MALIATLFGSGVLPAAVRAAERLPADAQTASPVVDRWDQVETWVGTAVIEDKEIHSNGATVVARHRVEFVVGFRVRRCRWSWETEWSPVGAAVVYARMPTGRVGMIKDAALYRLESSSPVSDEAVPRGRPRIVVTDPPGAIDPFGVGEFDPVWLLTAGERRLVDGAWSRSASAGGRWTVDYEDHDGVAVPRRIEIDGVGAPGGIARRRTIRFENSVINLVIARDAWSLGRLGARPGDLVRDERFGAQFVHQGEPNTGVVAGAAGDDSMLRIVAINFGAWVVVLGGTAAVGRWRRRTGCVAREST